MRKWKISCVQIGNTKRSLLMMILDTGSIIAQTAQNFIPLIVTFFANLYRMRYDI